MAAQIVVITGCSKGIGQGIALTLAKDPQRRFKVYAPNQEDTKTKAGSYYDDTLFIRELDVTKQETIDKTIKEIIEGEGKIDVLVNNAGISSPDWWQTAPMQTFYDVMDVNYFGCVRMTKAVAPIMKTQRSGKILQVSSVLGFKAISLGQQYISSKFALEGFSESIAPPLRKFNVWVSLIEPGFVVTPLLEKFGKDANGVFHATIDSWTDCPEEEATITRKMLTENLDIVLGTEIQSIEDIAKLVEVVLLSSKPDFRYQTSEMAKDFARQRFIDPSGNEIMNSYRLNTPIATNQEDTKAKAGKYYDDTLFIRELDVTKQETIDKTIKDIFEEEGRIDVLINNAGIQRIAWWQTAPMDNFYDVMDVNYFGCVRMTKAVAPIMKAQRSGKIIQISSVMGFKAIPICEPYTASKFALEGFSESIAPPLRKSNVWVSIIEPGFVLTPMIKLFGNDANSIMHATIGSWTDCPEEDVTITRKMLTENQDIVYGTEMLSIDDIAKVVEDAILSPKPDFRYQSPETVKEFARQRFVDPSGNEIMNSWLKQYHKQLCDRLEWYQMVIASQINRLYKSLDNIQN
ncbi:uncharacterized protein [Amphiura filiformis]|uniref:uncharacterized protein n=1 Tax=Amphiura filiformis TaxID=82378 RepID=UPI003B219F67